MGEITAASALDHVAGERPGGAGESEQGHVVGQLIAEPAQGFVDRGEMVMESIGIEAWNRAVVAHGRENRSGSLNETDLDAQRIGNHENIGKQNCPAGREAADRLKRRLDGKLGGVAEFQKIRGLCPECPIFGKIASRLAHEPERHACGNLPPKRGEQGFV